VPDFNFRLVLSTARISQSTAASLAMVPSPFVHEEIGLFVGIALESVFYGALQFSSSSFVIVILLLLGITALLYFLTLRNLLPRTSKSNLQVPWKLMGILTLQQVALLIAVVGNIQFCVLAFVYHRDTPGGPVAYQILNSNVAPGYASLASYSICNWLQDVILVRLSPEELVLTTDPSNSCVDSWSFMTNGTSSLFFRACYS